ncbi:MULTISPECIES: restriction endonuclease subunit S [Acidithiobacillus]|uniref:Restriction endonuclease subunit S n=2 Tax=Acidithiobacillus TaxID=119977 RepID=A0A2W1KPQ5_ACIFR|nr:MULTISPECIES: restriction endonuclease subunit S [Acidithiobacillus]MDA8152282.1 restriction endonuclease subunit S [Acidithiobacillus sp.]MBU2749569.1 restriction endonuclease subunit S [Acidithiobacillus thiooxidans]MBU2761408.1 restriction endonuclease subunit S [Acidithiobacillus sulfurivorans]MBU2817889.1 restriction endonuclease subunit S [Acidithiobacillus ferrooxidans]MBU2836112.1 restriction endonuclease subunit S [Acidithiobacillus thiooxidans]
MKETENRGRVPRLRFPEFRESGEWETKRLEDFAVIVRGGSPRPIDEFITNDANGLNWLKIGDIDKESKFVINTQEKVIPAALTKTRVVNPGDLILSNSMSFGRPYILEIKTCIHDGWIAVSEIDATIDRDYIYYLMMTSISQKYFSNNAAGSGVQNLNVDIIKFLPVLYPNKKEQQKIADCLSSFDDLITLEAQKLNALKTHKRGLMQQLFPAEGETVPRMRFPEFRDAWQIRKLEEIADFFKGKGISKADIDPQGQTPCIRYGELYTEYNESIKNVFSRTNVSPSELFLSRANDVIVPASGETKIDIARASCVKLDQVALGGDLNVLRPNIDGLFLSYILNGPAKEEIARTAQGDTVVHLYASQLKLIDLPVPGHEEQQKISDCLSSLDDLITAQAQKVGALKTHKKGLMQQLFPVLDDTPG